MTKLSKFIHNLRSDDKKILFYLLPLVLIGIIVQQVMKPYFTTEPRSKAQAVDSIYFVPSNATVATTPTNVEVRLNVGTKFADIIGVRITMDPAVVHVAPSGVIVHNTAMGANSGKLTVQLSPAAADTINTNGIIDLTMMVAPSSTDIRPSGDMLLATIPLVSNNTGTSPVSTQLVFHAVITEVYAGATLTDESTAITLSKNPATLTVNASGGSTLTPTNTIITQGASPSPTMTPSSTPSKTPTPSQTPGTSVTPSLTITPSRTPTPAPLSDISFDIRIKLNGVTGGAAVGALANVRFVKGSLDVITPNLPITYLGDGVYALRFITSTQDLAPDSGYTMIVKAEKHLSRKYCKQTGQTTICQPFESMSIAAPNGQPQVYDFTGFSLAPGDLYIQDGKADSADFDKIKTRMAISCDQLTAEDKRIADLDYNGCVNILDAFWMRNTLETRYDEN